MASEKSVASKLGQLLANVFVGCLTACVCAVMIAGAVRFIMWIF